MNRSEQKTARPALSAVLVQTLVPAAVGLAFSVAGKGGAAKVLWGISLFLLVTGLFIPFVFRRIEQFGRWIGKWAGLVITWALMMPVFYLIFLPGRLILRLRGIDPMCRKFPTDAPSYWVPRKPVQDAEDYKRQF